MPYDPHSFPNGQARMNKMNKTSCIALLLCTVVSLAGCKISNSGSTSSASMRVVNAVVDSEPLDVLVDSTVRATAVAADTASTYAQFDSGTRDVQVRSSTQGSILLDKSTAIAANKQTLVILGRRSAVATLLLGDETTDPASGKVRIRAGSLSP